MGVQQSETRCNPYDRTFYTRIYEASLRSARAVCPVVLSMVPAKSVIDVGCGVGTWLKAFQENGVSEILGMDGDHVERSQLLIPPDRFCPQDLTRFIPAPRRYDLAVSLEVGEHLPASSAEPFVSTLVGMSDVVLFSAAIPGQGGTNHINEQWPTYWRDLFRKHDYLMIDCLRERIWTQPEVEFYYSQNMFFCVRGAALNQFPELQRCKDRPVLDLVHPGYLDYMSSVRDCWIVFRSALIRELKRKLGITGSLRAALKSARRQPPTAP